MAIESAQLSSAAPPSATIPKMKTLVAALWVLLLFPRETHAQHIARIEKVTDRVTVLMPDERSGNTILLEGPEGVLLVDTMSDTLAAELVRTINGLDLGPVRYVFNTHWHQNHLGANAEMAETASVIGSANLRTRLQSPHRLEFLVQETFPALPPEYQPTVTFTDSISVHFNGEEVKAWHVRGHTDSDVIVYLTGSGVVATGDLWSQSGPFMTDLDTGGSLWGVASALKMLMERIPDDVVIVPGHSPPTDVAALGRYHAGLVATLQHVQRGKEAGLSASEIHARPLPREVQQFLTRNGARFIEAAFRSERGPN
jgi:cyclase